MRKANKRCQGLVPHFGSLIKAAGVRDLIPIVYARASPDSREKTSSSPLVFGEHKSFIARQFH